MLKKKLLLLNYGYTLIPKLGNNQIINNYFILNFIKIKLYLLIIFINFIVYKCDIDIIVKVIATIDHILIFWPKLSPNSINIEIFHQKEMI